MAAIIQIFGKAKCFDTKKAQRFFKERGVKIQYVDILEKGLSPRELQSVVQAVGDINALVDTKADSYALFCVLTPEAKPDKLLEDPRLFKTPITRFSGKACVGVQEKVWGEWLKP